MARKQDIADGSNNRRGGLLKYLINHPMLTGFLALIIIGVVLYTIQAVSGEASDIMKMYDIIGNVKTNSKADFDKRLFFITINPDGTKSVTVGFRSDVEKELADKAASEAGTGVGNFDDTAIDTELEQFITEMQAKEPTITKGSATVGFYVMNVSNDLKFAAGVMGNSSSEGTLGQWQSSSSSKVLTYGIYSSVYSGKKSSDMNSTGIALYNDLSAISDSNEKRETAIGWGPTQATFYTNIDKYTTAMKTLGLHTSSEIITENNLKAMESLYVAATFNKDAIRNPKTDYMNKVQYESDDVYNRVYGKIKNECDMLGVELTKEIVYDTYAVLINYERPTDYHTNTTGLNTCTDRAVKAVKAYIALQGVKNEE